MPTLLATDGISSLQGDFGVAVAAEVVNGGALDVGSLESVTAWDGDVCGDGVSLSRHGAAFFFFFCFFVCFVYSGWFGGGGMSRS